MQPATSTNPYEAPQSLNSVATEPHALGWRLPRIPRGVFALLFIGFCLIQYLPGYRIVVYSWHGKPGNFTVGDCNLFAIKQIAEQAFSLTRFLQFFALGAYLLLNILMLRQRLTLIPIVLIVLMILINGSWYYLLHNDKPVKDKDQYFLIGLYLQTTLMSLTSALALWRFLAERQASSSLARLALNPTR